MTGTYPTSGLSPEAVKISRAKYGPNTIDTKTKNVFVSVVRSVLTEPMFILLVIACCIYFLTGLFQEGIIMLLAVCLVAGISLFQDYRSRNAVAALAKISATKALVLRNGSKAIIPVEEIVVDDILFISEGGIIPADGFILSTHDLSVNESVLTGETFPANKNEVNMPVYKGTAVSAGGATVRVSAVGAQTEFGRIASSLQDVTVIKTPLQIRIASFIRSMAWMGGIIFLVVVAYNYLLHHNISAALIAGLTLAMSLLPEEIPVAFSTFQALGAFRLLRENIIVTQPRYVETLGSATVICADKTGTLTSNEMSIEYMFDFLTGRSVHKAAKEDLPAELIKYAMWASESNPFDPMEKAIHALYSIAVFPDERPSFTQVHEYPLAGKPPFMTHIFKNEKDEYIIAAKGAPEAILACSHLLPAELKNIRDRVRSYAQEGYRVLGVGKASFKGKPFPSSQESFDFDFMGLLAFGDPPKENAAAMIRSFKNAGIQVKMITGDYPETAVAISRQIGLSNSAEVLTGEEVMKMDAGLLGEKVRSVAVFARMFPDAKLKVIEALKNNGEVVAMTGDGVNDAPALKAAHIGIAMGVRGSEVAKSVAAVILADDDLSHMVQAVEQGRKIYSNLEKAIQYIVSIHIPIILIVVMPLVLSWAFADIFTPVHVIFLELIMGPTCSVIYENEPVEPGTLNHPPRKISYTFLSGRRLMISIIQGLIIAVSCLGMGYYYLRSGHSPEETRTVIFITLLFANIFLTLLNRSFLYPVSQTIYYKNKLLFYMLIFNLAGMAAFLYLPFLRNLFHLAPLQAKEILVCSVAALGGTVWVELYKKRGPALINGSRDTGNGKKINSPSENKKPASTKKTRIDINHYFA